MGILESESGEGFLIEPQASEGEEVASIVNWLAGIA